MFYIILFVNTLLYLIDTTHDDIYSTILFNNGTSTKILY
jgi:hypothetical protein